MPQRPMVTETETKENKGQNTEQRTAFTFVLNFA